MNFCLSKLAIGIKNVNRTSKIWITWRKLRLVFSQHAQERLTILQIGHNINIDDDDCNFQKKEGEWMVYSDDRKLCLSGWLQENGKSEYCSPLRLQKFLFFYETISKTVKDEYDLGGLKGWKRGPVFSAVWGDYSHDRQEFDERAKNAYGKCSSSIIHDRAELCHFIVSVFNETDLVEITHSMDIWTKKKQLIEQGGYQVPLDDTDLTSRDEESLRLFMDAFPKSFIDDCTVYRCRNICYVFSKEDYDKLTEEQYDTLWALSNLDSLENPVYAHIDEGGVVIID